MGDINYYSMVRHMILEGWSEEYISNETGMSLNGIYDIEYIMDYYEGY